MYFEEEEIETVSKHCKHPDCSYRRPMNGGNMEYCDHIGSTGKSRGCKISECDKYTTEKVSFIDDWAGAFRI